MLICNNEIYKLTADDIAAVKKEIGNKWPVTIKFPNDAYTAPRTYETALRMKEKKSIVSRRERPLIHPIPMKAEVHTAKGIEFWMYSRIPASRNEKNGQWKLAEAFLELEDEMQLQENQIELVFFLLFKSSVRKGGPNTRTHRPLFIVENKEKELANAVELRKIRSKVENQISEKMHIDHVKVMARAYRIPAVQLMGENELRETLIGKVGGKGIDGYKEFLSRLQPDKSGEQINRRTQRIALIQEAKDLKIIGTNKQGDKWYWLNKEGKTEGVITELLAGHSIDDSIEFKVSNDADLYDRIVEAVEAKKSEVEDK